MDVPSPVIVPEYQERHAQDEEHTDMVCNNPHTILEGKMTVMPSRDFHNFA